MGAASEIVHTLAEPVLVNGVSYSSITLRRPRTGEIRKIHRAGGFGKLMALAGKAEAASKAADGDAASLDLLSIYDDLAPVIAILAHVDEAVIDALEIADTTALISYLGGLIDGPLSLPATPAS